MTTEQAHTDTSVQAVRGMFGRDSIYLGLWAGQTIVAALITPVATRLLGPSQFGQVWAAIAVMQVLVALASFSLQTAVQRAFAEENGEAKARRLVALSVLLATTTVAIAYATGPLWSAPLGLGHFPLAVKYALAWGATTAMSNAALGLVRSRDQLGWFALAGLAQSIGAAGLAIAFVLVGRRDASNYLLGELVGQVLCVAVALFAARPVLPSRSDFPMLADALRYSAALAPGLLAGVVMDGSDRIVIHGDIGPSAVARFAVARNIGGIIAIFLVMLEIVWMPRLYALRDSPVVGAVIRSSRDGLVVLSVCMSVAIAMASPVLLWAWVPHSFHPDHLLLVTALIAAMGAPLAAGSSFVQVLLLANRSTRVSFATIGSAVINLGLILLVVPRYGIDGAAAVTLFSFTLQAAALWYFAMISGNLPPVGSWLLALLVGGAAICIASSAIPVDPVAIVVRLLVAAVAATLFCAQILTFVGPERLGRFNMVADRLRRLTISPLIDADQQPEG
jgi:O-antigen/teichoic acid export membrane protein